MLRIFNKTFRNRSIFVNLRRFSQKNEKPVEKKETEQKKLYELSYTPEEFQVINQKNEPVQIMEISNDNLKKFTRAKKLSIYFNLPISILLTGICEFCYPDLDALTSQQSKLYYAMLLMDYFFFFNGVMVLSGLRNIVLLAKYLPTEKALEVTKMNIFCKKYTKIHKIEDLKRVPRSAVTPFVSLKNKKNNELLSMNGLGVWKDIKLYNTLFPIPLRKKPSKENHSPFDN